MRDGYYLSTYLHVDPLSAALGWYHRHDQNMSLWKKKSNKISLIHYWDLERNSGIKHHLNSFYAVKEAKDTINKLLRAHDLTIDDMEQVWGTPCLSTCDNYHSLGEYTDIPYHCIAHLFSGLLSDSSIFYSDKIIGLAIDGGPDRVVDANYHFAYQYAACFSNKGEVEVFPTNSPGINWYHANYETHMREGTLMALGSACTCELLNVDFSGLFDEEDPYDKIRNYLLELKEQIDLFDFDDEGRKFNKVDHRFSFEENKVSMYVKVLQEISIRLVENNIDYIIEKYQLDSKECHLSITGGYALNCPTNSHLMRKYGFKSFLAPPCVNDSGISLGIALYAFYKSVPNLDFKLRHAFHGDEDRTESFLDSAEFAAHIESITELDRSQFVKDIIEHPLVWFNGQAEIGPRALGNRSILGDPRILEARNTLNFVKKREWWRPVAPIILAEDVSEWYENAYPSPYMLHTFRVKQDKLEDLRAVTHLDLSARVQTLTKQENPSLYKCIQQFKLETGVPVIANTSLNDKGEPIINTISEALNFALRKRIPVIYINNKRVALKNHDQYTKTRPYQRKLLEDVSNQELLRRINEHNPNRLSFEYMSIYCRILAIRDKFDIQTPEGSKRYENFALYCLHNRWRVNGKPAEDFYIKLYEEYSKSLERDNFLEKAGQENEKQDKCMDQ